MLPASGTNGTTSTAPIRGCSPDLGRHVDLGEGGCDQRFERGRHRADLAGDGEDAPVVARVARSVEEVGTGDGGDGRGEPVDDVDPAAFAHVGNRLDQAHGAIVAHPWNPSNRRPPNRPRLPRTCSAPATRSRGLLRQPDFVKLWTAETISQFGTQVTALAIPFVAIEMLGVSTFEVGLLNVVDFLPFLLVGLVAGVWVDRLRRRPILIAGDLGRAALLASIPVAYTLGVLTIWQLYVVGFLVGTLTVFFDVAYQSYLPSLVGAEHLVEGNGKLEISRSAAQVLGPGIGGLLIGVFRAPFAIVVDSLSYVGSAIFVFLIRRPEPAPAPAAATATGGTGMRAEIGEGLRYVLGHRYLRSIAACTASANLLANIGNAVLMVFALRVLRMPAEAIGLALSIGAIGALAGAVTCSRITALLGVGPTIVISSAFFAPAMVLLALVPGDAPLGVMVAVMALFGITGGFSVVLYNVNQVSLRQAITPARLQGRMNASMRWFVWGTIPGRRAPRRGARNTDRGPGDGASLRSPVMLHLPAGPPLAGPVDPHDAGGGRGHVDRERRERCRSARAVLAALVVVWAASLVLALVAHVLPALAIGLLLTWTVWPVIAARTWRWARAAPTEDEEVDRRTIAWGLSLMIMFGEILAMLAGGAWLVLAGCGDACPL